MERPPRPSPRVMSPPCTIKSGMIRWHGEPLYVMPLVPSHSRRKFSAVFGTTSERMMNVARPAGLPSICSGDM